MLFDQYAARVEAKLPLTYDVTLRYKGPTGKREWKHPYRLDLGIYLGSALPPKGLPELVAEVEKIRKELEKWKEGGRGLRVVAVDRHRQQRREWRHHHVLILRRQGPKALARSLWDRALWRLGVHLSLHAGDKWPHPYHGSRAHRRANPRCRRSCGSVGGEVMC